MKYLRVRGRMREEGNKRLRLIELKLVGRWDGWNARNTKTGRVRMNAVPFAIHLQIPDSKFSNMSIHFYIPHIT